jgi:hypothetical protein
VRVMAKQVRPWLMKPENDRAPTSAGKQTGVSQQNPSGTAAFAPQQSPDVRVQSKPVGRVTRRKAWQRVGASMYVHVRSSRSAKADGSTGRTSESAGRPLMRPVASKSFNQPQVQRLRAP